LAVLGAMVVMALAACKSGDTGLLVQVEGVVPDTARTLRLDLTGADAGMASQSYPLGDARLPVTLGALLPDRLGGQQLQVTVSALDDQAAELASGSTQATVQSGDITSTSVTLGELTDGGPGMMDMTPDAPPPPTCQRGNDCSGGAVCTPVLMGGAPVLVCQPPLAGAEGGALASCQSNSECLTGQCIAGFCFWACQRKQDCGNHPCQTQTFTIDGTTVSAQTCRGN
jgi:hypothetical protein